MLWVYIEADWIYHSFSRVYCRHLRVREATEWGGDEYQHHHVTWLTYLLGCGWASKIGSPNFQRLFWEIWLADFDNWSVVTVIVRILHSKDLCLGLSFTFYASTITYHTGTYVSHDGFLTGLQYCISTCGCGNSLDKHYHGTRLYNYSYKPPERA